MHSAGNYAEDSCLKNHRGAHGPVDSSNSSVTNVEGLRSDIDTHGDPEKGCTSVKDGPVTPVGEKTGNEGTTAALEVKGSSNAFQTPTAVDDGDDNSYPEGGLRAWLVVLGCTCSLFMVFGLANSSAAFQEIFASDLLAEYSADQIGWIFSVNLFFTFFGGIYVGNWFDAHGPRLPVAIGTVGMVLSLMLLGLCTEYWHFILDYSVLAGLSGALLMTPSYGCVAHYFKKRRGLATGVSTTASSFGGIILPLMLRSLLPQVGFAWASRIIGFVFLTLAIPANLLIRSRLPPTMNKMGVLPHMYPFKNLRFAVCVLGIFLMEWGLFIPLAYISSYCTYNGYSASFGFLAITLLNVGSVFGRLIPGILSDKIGRFNMIVVTIFFCSITVFALWLPAGNSMTLIVVFVLFFGFFSGSNLSLIPVCLSQLCKTEEFGRYLAAAYFIGSFGTLISVPIGGALLPAADGQYWGLIVLGGLSYVAATVCYTYTRVSYAGWNPKTIF